MERSCLGPSHLRADPCLAGPSSTVVPEADPLARRSPKSPDPRLVDNRNRVALSKEAMRALDVKAGDYVTFVIDDSGTVRLHKLHITVAPAKARAPRDA